MVSGPGGLWDHNLLCWLTFVKWEWSLLHERIGTWGSFSSSLTAAVWASGAVLTLAESASFLLLLLVGWSALDESVGTFLLLLVWSALDLSKSFLEVVAASSASVGTAFTDLLGESGSALSTASFLSALWASGFISLSVVELLSLHGDVLTKVLVSVHAGGEE